MRIFTFLLLWNDSLGFAPHDPCTLFHPSSKCAESGHCTELTLSIGASETMAVSCRQAYVSVSILEKTNGTDPPLICPISNEQFRDQIERQILVSRGYSVIDPPLSFNSTTIVSFTRLLSSLSEKLKSEFPWLVYSHQDDAVLLRRIVQLSHRIRQSLTRAEFNTFQFFFAQENSVRVISAYLRALIGSIYTIGDIHQRTGLIGHSIPFFHLWLCVLSNFDYPTMFIDSRDFGFYSLLIQYDPLYPLRDSDKVWIFGISQTILERPDEQVRFQPMIQLGDFPLAISEKLDSQSIVEFVHDTISEINETLRSGNDIRYVREDLEAALWYMHYYENVTDEMRADFCISTRESWLLLFTTISEPRHVQTETFGNINLLELFRICGKQYFKITERTLHVLPAIGGVRSMDYAHARYILTNLRDPASFWIPRVIEVIDSIPIYHIRKWVLLVFEDDSNHSNTQTMEYFAFLTEIVQQLTTPGTELSLFGGANEDGELIPLHDASLRSLRVFGSAVAILLIHGDPFEALSTLFQLNKTSDFYFNSVSVQTGFCLVVNCFLFDELFDKFELPEMIHLVRDHEVLARTSIA